jgi:shikimate dehydrogenase
VGHNTDVAGAARAIRAVRDVAHADVVVLGAGGSAAAVVLALEALGAARLTMIARSAERAHALVARIAPSMPVQVCAHDASASSHLAQATLVVNTTPLGLRDGDPFPVAPEALAPAGAALDLVYRAGETPWVRTVRASGRRAEDGLRMLVEQGAAAFAWWFGRAPDRQAMWSVLEPRGADGAVVA